MRLAKICCLVSAALAAHALGGCATLMLETADSEPGSLPRPRMSPDTVIVEITTVVVPAGQEARCEAIWQAIDEQHLPTDLRQSLAANGMRCGLIGARLPLELEQLLTAQSQATPAGSSAAGVDDSGAVADRIDDRPRPGTRRLQSRAGRRGEILLTPVRERLTLVEVDADQRLRGRDYRQAQGLLALVTRPQGDGRVQLELIPEVHHGEARQRYQGEGGVFHIELGRDRQPFQNLRIETLIAPGQTLALGCADAPRGLGQQLFTEKEGPLAGRKILLIRLASTQFDDLFAPDRVVAPLVTADP